MILFFLNVGRSGSLSVARHFGILHEPQGVEASVEMVKRRVWKDGRKISYYGETSHFWKDKIDELKESFPNAIYIHLIRNGRDVVSSFMASTRHYKYKNRDPRHRNEELPIIGFNKMSRFEKLCWYWRYWNEEIEERTKIRVKLEDIPYMKKFHIGKPHPVWNEKMEKAFISICIELNNKYGYE